MAMNPSGITSQDSAKAALSAALAGQSAQPPLSMDPRKRLRKQASLAAQDLATMQYGNVATAPGQMYGG
ncbi:MAG TPA: hypothetical protein VMU02_04450 [bacterium]|nr:hypothetical protein [bacterium]